MLTSSPESNKFAIRQEENQTTQKTEAVRFVIRVDGVKERRAAIAEFEAESAQIVSQIEVKAVVEPKIEPKVEPKIEPKIEKIHAEATPSYLSAELEPLTEEDFESFAASLATTAAQLQVRETAVSQPISLSAEEVRAQKSAQLVMNADLLCQHREKNLARVLLQEALNLDSKNSIALSKLLSLVPAGDQHLQERMQLARALYAVAPTSEHAVQLAKLLYDQNDLDGALELYFQAASQISDENQTIFEIYKDIGNIYVRQKDFDGAEEYYHKAFALNPDSDTLHVNLGTLEIQRQDWGQARDRFRTALTLNAKSDRAWVGLALAHESLGDVDLAFANLINALDIHPENRTAVHLLAVWGQKYNRPEEAIEPLQHYLSGGDYDEEMSLALIELLCEKKDYRLARLELERVLCWHPERRELAELEARLMELDDEA